MAIGNIVGSNIFNVFAILGICALIRPLGLTADNIRRDIPFGMVASLLLVALVSDSFFASGATDRIGRIDGIVMLLLYVLLVGYTIRITGRTEASTTDTGTTTPRMPEGSSPWRSSEVLPG